MHNLALELKALGNEVTGSDDEISTLPKVGWKPLEFYPNHLDGSQKKLKKILMQLF